MSFCKFTFAFFVFLFLKLTFLGSAGRAEPFKSAAPFSQRGVAGRVEPCVRNLQTPKPLTDPALPADLHLKSPFADPRASKSQFSADLLPIENSSKIGLLKNPPEIAKSRSRIAKCRFRMDFESPFGIIFAPFSVILPSFFPISFWHRFWKDF